MSVLLLAWAWACLACSKEEVVKGSTPVTEQSSYSQELIRGTTQLYLNWITDLADPNTEVVTTPAGRVYLGYDPFNEDQAFRYGHTDKFQIGDSVVIRYKSTKGPKTATFYIYQNLPHYLFHRSFTPTFCGLPATYSMVSLDNPVQQTYESNFLVLKQPRNGNAMITNERILYEPRPGFKGWDTVMVGYSMSFVNDYRDVQGRFPMAFLVSDSASDPCLSRLEARDDVISLSTLPRYATLTADLLLANDTYCPGYLDTRIEFRDEAGNPVPKWAPNSGYPTVSNRGVVQYSQPEFLKRVVLLDYVGWLQPGTYFYTLRTIGSTSSTAKLTLNP